MGAGRLCSPRCEQKATQRRHVSCELRTL
jgi:hypothetical protein